MICDEPELTAKITVGLRAFLLHGFVSVCHHYSPVFQASLCSFTTADTVLLAAETLQATFLGI